MDVKEFQPFKVFPGITGPGGTQLFGDLFSRIATYLFIFGFIIAFTYLLYGGFRLITAGGNERSVAEARDVITYAIVGIAVVFLAFLLVRLAQGITGVSIL